MIKVHSQPSENECCRVHCHTLITFPQYEYFVSYRTMWRNPINTKQGENLTTVEPPLGGHFISGRLLFTATNMITLASLMPLTTQLAPASLELLSFFEKLADCQSMSYRINWCKNWSMKNLILWHLYNVVLWTTKSKCSYCIPFNCRHPISTTFSILLLKSIICKYVQFQNKKKYHYMCPNLCMLFVNILVYLGWYNKCYQDSS